MIFFFLQKVLFSHPDSYNIKKSDIREAPTLSTGAHSSNNTIKYLKTLLGTFTQFVALFLECHVMCFMFHYKTNRNWSSKYLPRTPVGSTTINVNIMNTGQKIISCLYHIQTGIPPKMVHTPYIRSYTW